MKLGGLIAALLSSLALGEVMSAEESAISGSWIGKLEFSPEHSLRVVLNIKHSSESESSVTMDSPDQGAYGIPMLIAYIDNDSISVTYPQQSIAYCGRLDCNAIKGTFRQGLLNMSLTLSPKSVVQKRPQTPRPPFTYQSEDLKFQSPRDGAMLYGTMCCPPDATTDTPVVVMVSGSGLQNRDEEIFEHKPFAVIADYLARNGIASLRYDDRGYDKSTGYPPNDDTYQNAMDAKGAIAYLKALGFSHIGIIGHSEGGLIADILAAEGNDIDFIVEIGGPAVSGDNILIYQNEFIFKDAKMPDNYVSMYADALRGVMDSHKKSGPIQFDESRYEIFSDKWKNDPVVAPLVKSLKDNFYQPTPWLRYFINYNPIIDIKKITVPLFMIYGEKDTQVPPSINVPVLEACAPHVKVKTYQGLNHLMQHCLTGKVTEYSAIEETISPEVLEDIKTFILSTK